MWRVVETDSQGTKRPCGTFPQLHTNTYYLHFNVSFLALGRKKENWPSVFMSAEPSMTLEESLSHQFGSVSACAYSALHFADLSYSLCGNRTEISLHNLDSLGIAPLGGV